jgi:integrase
MPIRRDPQGRYHAEVCVGRRRLHRILPPGATARDAKALEADLHKALRAAEADRAPVIPGDPALVDVVGLYLQDHAKHLRSADTAGHHANRIGPWLVGRRASDARAVAAQIVANMRGQYANATINRSLGILKKSLSIAWERGLTTVDHSTLIKRLPENNQRTVYLTMDQVALIASHASETVRAAIWIALLTGCRRGEVCKMQQSDIGAQSLRIQAGNTKTLRYREVPIVPALRPWLKFVPLTINFEGVKTGFRRAREAAGMPEVHFHDLRHSCATILLQLGADLHVVREILGHTSVKTTERYAHVMIEPQRKALEKLGRLHSDLYQDAKRRPKTPLIA